MREIGHFIGGKHDAGGPGRSGTVFNPATGEPAAKLAFASAAERREAHTVCQEARCPNIYECWGQGTATFMILGDVCTRDCGFCSVMKGKPGPVDPLEPGHVADAIEKLKLQYAVITSVDRDDLPDEGAGHFVRVITAVRSRTPGCRIEVLIPDFNGRRELLEIVLDARPDCLAHNIETASHLYRRVRPVAVYENTLKVLEQSVLYREKHRADIHVKCGIMVLYPPQTPQFLQR